MKLKKKIIIGAVGALALGAVIAQSAVYGNAADERPTVTIHASWDFHPQTLKEARDHAQTIVLAQVVSVRAGDDIVTREPGEPDGVDRIPTQRVTVTVLQSFKGTATANQQLTLFQTGGVVSTAKAGDIHPRMVLDGDPFYANGEQYLLMLVPGPRGTLRVIAPEGRYRYNASTGALTPMVAGPVADQVKNTRLTDLKPTLTSAS
jgi:hypothetical protein